MFIELYEKWLEKGELPYNGICCSLPYDAYMVFISYLTDEQIWNGGYLLYNGEPISEGDRKCNNEVKRSFTPLRQTMVLLLAAINNEL